MKCRNCDQPREAHIRGVGERGQRVWQCPNGSGTRFPTATDVRIRLHFRAGDDSPWVASWEDAVAGKGQAVGRLASEALEAAGKQIEHGLEEEPEELAALQQAIKER